MTTEVSVFPYNPSIDLIQLHYIGNCDAHMMQGVILSGKANEFYSLSPASWYLHVHRDQPELSRYSAYLTVKVNVLENSYIANWLHSVITIEHTAEEYDVYLSVWWIYILQIRTEKP